MKDRLPDKSFPKITYVFFKVVSPINTNETTAPSLSSKYPKQVFWPTLFCLCAWKNN